jgi:hypothetical protein
MASPGAGLRAGAGEPKLGAGISREMLQRDAAGIAAEKPLLPGSPKLYLQAQRGESLIDQSSRSADAIAFLRGERRTALRSDQSLTQTIQGLLADPSLRSSAAGFFGASKLTEMMRSLLQRITAAAPARKAHEELQQHDADTQLVKKQKKSLDDNTEDALLDPDAIPAQPAAAKSLFSRALTTLSMSFSDFVRFVGRVCSEAISGIRAFIKGRAESQIFTPWKSSDTTGTETPSFIQASRKPIEPPPDWTQRFGEDPAEQVKADVKSMQAILEELAREEYLEEQAEERKESLESEERRERMNKLRDLLAKFLTPFSDGTVPAQFLSRHYVGPWVTTQDLMHALQAARAERAA